MATSFRRVFDVQYQTLAVDLSETISEWYKKTFRLRYILL
jgi:hypothetical protein